jgi:hypothetical protein
MHPSIDLVDLFNPCTLPPTSAPAAVDEDDDDDFNDFDGVNDDFNDVNGGVFFPGTKCCILMRCACVNT